MCNNCSFTCPTEGYLGSLFDISNFEAFLRYLLNREMH
jgi:hypothetical protein